VGRPASSAPPPDLARKWAGSSKGYWRLANTALHRALPNAYWTDLGLAGFSDSARRLRST
jgi:hypothetical protein